VLTFSAHSLNTSKCTLRATYPNCTEIFNECHYAICLAKLGPTSITGGLYFYLTAVGETFYFGADDGIHGDELWKSDGTSSGTVMVKDIYPGEDLSFPVELTAVGETLYFSADDGIHGHELWRSDGTSSGTVMVKDIYPGANSSSPYYLTTTPKKGGIKGDPKRVITSKVSSVPSAGL